MKELCTTKQNDSGGSTGISSSSKHKRSYRGIQNECRNKFVDYGSHHIYTFFSFNHSHHHQTYPNKFKSSFVQ